VSRAPAAATVAAAVLMVGGELTHTPRLEPPLLLRRRRAYYVELDVVVRSLHRR
jgi:hypothetical protein